MCAAQVGLGQNSAKKYFTLLKVDLSRRNKVWNSQDK